MKESTPNISPTARDYVENIGDLVRVGKSGNTFHRPDGKFLSVHELKQISNNADLIRGQLGYYAPRQEEIIQGPMPDELLAPIQDNPADPVDETTPGIPYYDVESLIEDFTTPLYNRYKEAKEEYVAAHAKARLADVGVGSMAKSVIDKYAGSMPWAQRLTNKLNKFRKGSPPETDDRQIAYDNFKKEYEDALDAAVRSCMAIAGKNFDDRDQELILLNLEVNEAARLEGDISSLVNESGKKRLMSRKVGTFVGAGVAALAGISSGLARNSNSPVWLAAGVAAGAASGYVSAKMSRFTGNNSVAEGGAAGGVYMRHAEGAEVGNGLAIDVIENDTSEMRVKRINQLIGATALGATAGMIGYTGASAFSGAITPNHPNEVGKHQTGVSSYESTPVAGATPVVEATPPSAPNPVDSVVIGPQGPSSLESAGHVVRGATMDAVDQVNNSTSLAGVVTGEGLASSVDMSEVIPTESRTIDSDLVRVPDDVTNPPRTAIDTTVRVPEDLPAGDVPLINPQGGVDPNNVGSEPALITPDIATDTSAGSNEVIGTGYNAYVNPNDGPTQLIDNYIQDVHNIDLSPEQMNTMFSDLFEKGNYKLPNAIQNVDFYTMSDGRQGIKDVGPAKITPAGQDMIEGWLRQNGLLGV